MGALLGLKDYRTGLEVVRAMTSATTDVATFARAGVELLTRNVGSELTTLSECDLVSGRRAIFATPGSSISAADRACFDRHFKEHPLVRFHAYAGGRTTHRISDSLPFARFQNTSLFNEYYRRIGIDHAVALPVFVDEELLVSFVLNRARTDFTDRELAWLDSVRDALAALYRNARALQRAQARTQSLAALLDRAGVAVVVVDRNRVVRDWTPAASAALERCCRVAPCTGARLAEAIDTWLHRLLTTSESAFGQASLLRLESMGGTLTLHALRAADATGSVYLLIEEAATSLSDQQLARWPLTQREREMLRWLALGKTDREIAALASVSVRTVHKHLQRIYEKLGVETRTAAVMRAIDRRSWR